MSDHKSHGPNVVRRLYTPDPPAYWPEYHAVGTSFVETGWGGYIKALCRFTGTAAVMALQMIESGTSPSQVPPVTWSQALFLDQYQKSDSVPSAPGVANPIVDYCLEERVWVGEDDSFNLSVHVYAPHSEDKLPGGVRLPMSSVEKLTHEVGSLTISVGPEHCATATGVLAEDEDVQEVVRGLNNAARG